MFTSEVATCVADMLEYAGECAGERGGCVAVLSMASASCPGGGVDKGVGAQEENLHRRSDLLRFTKWQPRRYPIREGTCVLAADVTVFRGTEQAGYPFLDHPFRITVISCAAVRNPRLDAMKNYARREDWEAM